MFVVTVTGIYRDGRSVQTTLFPKTHPFINGRDILRDWRDRARRDREELVAGFVAIKEQERIVGFIITDDELIVNMDRRPALDVE